MVERLFLKVPGGCLQFVIVVFPDHTHLLFLVFKIYAIVFTKNFKFSHLKSNQYRFKKVSTVS